MKTLESILIAFTSYSDYRFYAEILCQLNRHCKCVHVPEGASLSQFFSSRKYISLAAAIFEGPLAVPIFEDTIAQITRNATSPSIPVGLIIDEREFWNASHQMQGKKARLIKKSDQASYLKQQFAAFLFPPLISPLLKV